MCQKCKTKKYTKVEIFGAMRTVPCMCKCEEEEYKKQKHLDEVKEKQHRLEKLRNHSLMGAAFETSSFDNWDMDKSNQRLYDIGIGYCKEWHKMKRENVGFLFHGSPGIGKSYLSFCIANQLLKKYVPVIAISSIGILNRIKETYKQYGRDGEVEVINSLKNASLLVLDDLGAENRTDWSRSKLYEIIDSRYRDKKPLIITTNLTVEQLKYHLQSEDGVNRTYDRIIEMCMPMKVEGPSRRAKVAQQKQEIIRDLISK